MNYGFVPSTPATYAWDESVATMHFHFAVIGVKLDAVLALPV